MSVWSRTASVVVGSAILAFGVLAIASPHAFGPWASVVVGLALMGDGLLSLLRAVRGVDTTRAGSRYVGAIAALLAGLVLLARSSLLMSGLIAVLGVLFVLGGLVQVVSALRRRGSDRTWGLLGGIVEVAIGLALWALRHVLGLGVLGLLAGLQLIAHGWQVVMEGRTEGAEAEARTGEHPDTALALPPSPVIADRVAAVSRYERERRWVDIGWVVTFVVVFFAIHYGRMPVSLNRFGTLSVLVAVLGDLFAAALVTVMALLPLRVLLRRLTRGVERSAWRARVAREERGEAPKALDRLVGRWLDRRLRFVLRAREVRRHLRRGVFYAVQAGLPVVAVLVAVNPVLGFSWYFNSENWVSGLWQAYAAAHADEWRVAMTEAVEKAAPDDAARADLFRVAPPGVEGSEDFAFLVIGDTGEGDPSQFVLHDRLVVEGRRPEVKFVVVASDVIYPGGAMRDYERNFYLAFKGVEKPVYAIPGNHDWYDALDAFVANFFQPEAARTSLHARRALGAPVEPSEDERIDALVAQAGRLRQAYGVSTGHQAGPYFELRTDRFAFVAVDTGVNRDVDEPQRKWFEAALARAEGRFTMVLLGHPLYAKGICQSAGDAAFTRIHETVRRHRVPVVMAGDTHDFEYYRELRPGASGEEVTHHFVNGGGGAYLSIGTALDWPKTPPVADFAFYPRTDAITAKLDAEAQGLRRPVWWWVRDLRGWPTTVETLSGIFDFNHAPFFQSFMEVRVEGSQDRVRYLLHGASGPLRWKDIQVGGATMPEGASADDLVEFVVPMPR